MNKHVKKTVLALCYVLSIFLALVIGFHIHAKVKNGATDCPILTIHLVTCENAKPDTVCSQPPYYDMEQLAVNKGYFKIEPLYVNCVKYYISPSNWLKDPNCVPSAMKIIPCED